MPQQELVTEDWKKEYEKFILSRKYAEASSRIGAAFTDPCEEVIIAAYGSVVDFVTNMPVGLGNDDNKTMRDGFLASLDRIETVIFGNPSSKNTQAACASFGVFRSPKRAGVRIVQKLQNLPELLKELRKILIDAGDFATAVGLRITLSKQRKFGMEKIKDEEGMDDFDF